MLATVACGHELTGSPFRFLHIVSRTRLGQTVLYSVDEQETEKNNPQNVTFTLLNFKNNG